MIKLVYYGKIGKSKKDRFNCKRRQNKDTAGDGKKNAKTKKQDCNIEMVEECIYLGSAIIQKNEICLEINRNIMLAISLPNSLPTVIYYVLLCGAET